MMLTMTLIILIFLIIGLTGTFVFNTKKYETLSIALQIIGYIFTFVGVIAWYAAIAPHDVNHEYTITTQIKPSQIIKSKTSVYVEFEDYETNVYSSKKNYDSIDSTTVFHFNQYYNYYGNKVKYSITLN